ncbi:S9 family peptidase [Methylocapsa acidiphila]|uniref:S9 family peptidase n=1 Tax=Methylocapsa acidiphila TaxID=133552 RepID=UPI000410139D|nr:S9 family peptidase [Methylocapsa acidiphila]
MTGRAASGRTASPPSIEARPAARIVQGAELRDEYAWLRAENWREVLRDPDALPAEIRAVVEAENRFAAAVLAPEERVRKTLAKEMRGRIKEDDADVPLRDGPWLYYSRHRRGGQHPIFCRVSAMGEREEILLDGDAQARGKEFFDLGEVRHSPDHARLAWSVDEMGSELYAIDVRDLASGKDLAETIVETNGSFVWMTDSLGFYYVRVDENHRPAAIFRHRIGDDPAKDALIFEERDPGTFIYIRRSQSGAFAIISVSDHDSSECRLLDLRDPDARPRLVEPRAPGLRYWIEDRGARLFLRTNADGAEDFKIVSAPLETPGKAFWVDEIPYAPGRMIVTAALFPDHLVRLEREAGLPQIVIRHFDSGAEHKIAFGEEAYSLGLEELLDYSIPTLRFIYSSLTTPEETYDYDLNTGARVLRKRQEIPSGHDPALYVTRRLFAPAADGELVPVSILYRADLRLDGVAPVLLYGYGAYGSQTPASFEAERLSLVDRGFIYAIAHVRGGSDNGWRWYTDGKLANKPNTFSDFIAAARHLIAEGLTKPGRIVAEGASAGGMLIGAVVNLAPELFAGAIADVPFVDVLNTMLDGDLPLTPPEWLEWGDPITDAAAFVTIRSYSPYDNIKPQRYPPILALGGLADPRVTYWEPLKWVARLRATMTGGGPILLSTNMGAGHAGASGRFDHLDEIAQQYAFALACAEGRYDAEGRADPSS